MTVAFSIAPIGECSFAALPNIASSESLNESNDVSIPTEKQLENAAPNQLIITYTNDALDIEDTTEVASLDGSPLEEIAESAPNEIITLSDIGAIDVDSVSEQGDDTPASSLVSFEKGVDIQEVSAQLISSPDVARVQPNYIYELFSVGSTTYYDAPSPNGIAKHATNDPYSFVDESKSLNQSYIYTTKVADAWAAGYKSDGAITVAVIDSGPRLDHPDLSSAWDLTHARDFTNTTSANGVPYSDSSSFWSGKTGNVCHGTWVSGIIGATANNEIGIAGTSYNAKVLPIKVTDGQDDLRTSTIVKAYNYLDKLVESGQLPTLKVINLSLGGREFDYSFNASVNHMATAHNVLTVAAAGNDGNKIAMYPADFDNVLSVMATDYDFTRASFSNYGKKDVSAPGTSVTTTIPWSSSWDSYNTSKYSKIGINGTSFSAPIVSGIAALCYSVKPNARFDEVKWAIKSGATSLADIDSTCAPYVNALQAVKNVKNGMGLYEATHTSIEKAKVSYIAPKTYSGKWIKPTPNVTLGGKKLTKGVDFTVSYLNNKRSGKATIIIRATGMYKGTKRATFNILPKESRVVRLQSRHGAIAVKWKSRSSSASGYQIRYSTSSRQFSTKKLKRGTTVTIVGKNYVSSTLRSLESKTRYYVQVRTYKKSNGVLYYSKWSAIKKAKTF